MTHSKRKKNPFRHLAEFWSEERNLSILLGIVIFEIFFLPALPTLTGERLIVSLLNNLVFSFLLLFGILAITSHKAVQRLFAVIVVVIILVRWARLIFTETWLTGWDIFLTISVTIAFVVVILEHVYKDGPVTFHRIQGAIAAYLLIALAFAFTFFLLETLNPHSLIFTNQVAIPDDQPWRIYYYFSICNLTTLGYGDITPVVPLTQNLVIAEALIGQLYPAILLARLVSLHTQEQLSKKSNNNSRNK